MAADEGHQLELTLESVRYQLIGSGLEATLVDTGPDPATPDGAASKAWRCSACRADFRTARRFEAHLGLHTNICPRQCHLCEHQLVGTVPQLRRHLRSHTRGLRNACRHCARTFPSAGDLYHHRRLEHAAVYRFPCDLCPRSFVLNSQLRNHCLKHSAPQPHACSECEKTFTSAVALKEHKRRHKKPFACDYPGCSYLGRAPVYVRAHVDQVHRKTKRLHCPQCTKEFTYTSSLRLHVRKEHGEKSKGFACRTCGEVLKSRGSLAVHRRSHVTGKDQTCHVCGSTFPSHQALNKHLAEHMEEQEGPHATPFKCECGKTFRTNLTLGRHRMVHQRCRQRQQQQGQPQPQLQRKAAVAASPQASDATLQPTADASDATSQQADDATPQQLWGKDVKLNVFRGLPPGLRPSILCLECGEEFNRSLTLQKHYQEKHSSSGPFHCPNCGVTFRQARLFARHRAEMHMEYLTDSGTVVEWDTLSEGKVRQRMQNADALQVSDIRVAASTPPNAGVAVPCRSRAVDEAGSALVDVSSSSCDAAITDSAPMTVNVAGSMASTADVAGREASHTVVVPYPKLRVAHVASPKMASATSAIRSISHAATFTSKVASRVAYVAGPSGPLVSSVADPSAQHVVHEIGVGQAEDVVSGEPCPHVSPSAMGEDKQSTSGVLERRARDVAPRGRKSTKTNTSKKSTGSRKTRRRSNRVIKGKNNVKSEYVSGAVAPVSDSESENESRREPAIQPRRSSRSIVPRSDFPGAEELYRRVMGSSSEDADDTGSNWEPDASDSDRELRKSGWR